jgi:hypothetical protein
VEGIQVPGDGVGAELVGGVRVGGQPPDGFLPADDLAPAGSPRGEEPLLSAQAVQDRGLLPVQAEPVSLVGDGEPAKVTDVFPKRQPSVDGMPGRRIRGEGVELLNQPSRQRLECLPVILRPPVAQFASAVELRPLVIEPVADLVADHRSDTPVVDRVIGVGCEERRLQDRRREDDLVQHRMVVGVDRLGSHQPLVVVHGLAHLVQVAVDVGVVGAFDVTQQV